MNPLKRMLNKASTERAEVPTTEAENRNEGPSAMDPFNGEIEAVGGADTAIAEAIGVLTTNRENIVRSLHARDGAGNDHPRNETALGILQGSRRRILDQLNASRVASEERTGGMPQITELNETLAKRQRDLTAELNAGSISARLFILQLRAEVASYLDSVEKLLKPITIQVS
jgi:hypothetical protein